MPQVRLAESVHLGVRNPPSMATLVERFPRTLELATLTCIVDHAMRKFELANDDSGKIRVECDAWLAPRLHASLRLTRKEATDQRVWVFLAAFAFPDYVLSRWGDNDERFFSTDLKKHAFRRLWWGAELFRNGPRYDTVEQAFRQSDIPNTFLALRAVHSRPVALALLDLIARYEMTSRQTNALATQLNSSAVTVALDRACPTQDDAFGIDDAWLAAVPDVDRVLLKPLGPDQGSVDDSQISAVRDALDRVIDINKIRDYRREPRPARAQKVAV